MARQLFPSLAPTLAWIVSVGLLFGSRLQFTSGINIGAPEWAYRFAVVPLL